MILNSRYKIIKKLGEGRGNVFLVQDLSRVNEFVALKAISKEKISQNEIKSLINEFRILKRFRHPNVVRVFDIAKVYESDDTDLIDTYFYTAEFIDGQNLIETIKHSADSSIQDFEIFKKVLFQICSTLYYIHQSGLIHYDIKPENILIQKSHSGQISNIKLIDFGFGAEGEARLRGTPAYVSPEIIKGEISDHRSDLYSLGATLYHLFAGKPPFEADDQVDLLKLHLSAEPEPLPAFVPSSLQEVISKLMRKNPEERYSNSLEIITELETDLPIQFENTWFFPKVLSTREEEVEEIHNYIREGKNSQFNGYLIFGEEGTGKSLLIENIEQTLNDNNHSVYLVSNPQQSFRAYDYWLNLIQMIKEHLRSSHANEENAQAVLVSLAKMESLFDPERGSLLKPESFRIDLAEALIDYAECEPFVLLIDDFQNLDKISKEFLRYIVPALNGYGVKTILTLTTSQLNDDFVKSLVNFETIVLSPLDREQVLQLLRAYFKWGFPYNEVAEMILEYVDCLPSSVKDFLDYLLQNKIITIDHRNFQFHAELVNESSIREDIVHIHRTRFENLSKNEKEILTYLSCIPFPISIDDLALIIGWSSEELKNTSGQLASLGWVKYEIEARTLFIPIKSFRSYLYSTFTDRNSFHLKAAEVFRSLNYTPDLIAGQHELAGNKSEAYKFYTEAALSAEKLEAFSLMEEILDKASKNLLSEEEQFLLEKNYVRCYYHLSQFNKTSKLIESLLNKNVLNNNDKFQFTLWLASIYYRLGESDKSLNIFDDVYNLALTVEDKLKVEIEQININTTLGNYTLVGKQCENILNEYNEFLNDPLKASVLNNLGIANFMEGNYEIAAREFGKALTIYETKGDKVKLSQLNMNLGNVHNIKGERKEAFKYWYRSMEINESYGDLAQKAKILNNMGISAYDEFEYDEALKYYREAKEIFEIIGDSMGKGLVLFNISETALSMCNYTLAFECLNESKEYCKRLNDNEGLAQSLFYLGRLYLIFNQTEIAESIYSELENLVELNKLQPSQMPYMLFLSASIKTNQKEYGDAEIKFELARELFKENSINYYDFKCSLQLMEIYLFLGKYEEAIRTYNGLTINETFLKNKLLHAESLFIMGKLTKRPGVDLSQTAIDFYTSGLSLLENMPISEVTWQLVFYLGEEYLTRGVYQKGTENLTNAKLLLSYLCRNINEKKFLDSYVNQPERKRIIEKIAKNLVN